MTVYISARYSVKKLNFMRSIISQYDMMSLSYHIISCRGLLYHISIPYHIISYHIISRYIISYHIISYINIIYQYHIEISYTNIISISNERVLSFKYNCKISQGGNGHAVCAINYWNRSNSAIPNVLGVGPLMFLTIIATKYQNENSYFT